jgi:ferredoxin
MTHVVTENCINCKHTTCVDVCPVDCFKQTPLMLVIDSTDCIDCAVCIPECPVNAIYAEEDVPEGQHQFIALNKSLAETSPSITRTTDPMSGADHWLEVKGKSIFLRSGLIDEHFATDSKELPYYKYLSTTDNLTKREWTKGLESPDPIARFLAASRPDFVLDRRRLTKGLADTDENIRLLYLRLGVLDLNKADMATLLNDPSINIRLELLRTRLGELTKQQIDKTLSDSEKNVRMSILTSPTFFPTDKQFFRILNIGEYEEVRTALLKMSATQARTALRHTSAVARAAAFGFHKIKLSPQEINLGLEDSDKDVRLAVINRDEFELTPTKFIALLATDDQALIYRLCQRANETCIDAVLDGADSHAIVKVLESIDTLTSSQITKTLASTSPEVELAALARLDSKITQKQIDVGLRSKNENVRLKILNLCNAKTLKPAQIENCLSDASEKIRALIARIGTLTPDQIERALCDQSQKVRYAILCRPDFIPDHAQLNRGLKDRAKEIQQVFSKRFSVDGDQVIIAAKRDIHTVLIELSEIKTWTKRRHQLKEELDLLLTDAKYLLFTVDARQAPLISFGNHEVIEVAAKKRGALEAFRGKRVHLIRLGTGPYSSVEFAAKAVDF